MRRSPPTASNACWKRRACGATPGTRSSAPATSRSPTSPRRAIGACIVSARRSRDSRLFARLPGPDAPLAEAEAIVCTGLVDEINHSVETYRPLIEEGIARGLPFVCANPDLVVDVGDKRYLCAGSIAAEYERCGGSVFWAGKPHPSAYRAALERAGELRGAEPERARILAIGDAVRTDLAAAQGMGIDALFIASGIHNDEVLVDGEIDPDKLAALFAPGTPPAVAAMTQLRW